MYINDRRAEIADATIRSHRSRLNHWITYCNDHDIETLDERSPMQAHKYKAWRRDRGDINHVTLKTQLDTLRVHLKWANGCKSYRKVYLTQ